MQRKWNRADWMLFITALLFLLSIYFRIRFNGAVWAEGLLFCSEAALVGGIADWFAVKALFGRPLGCPYHTRLIPRRRRQIIEASSSFIKQEFFSRRNLLQYLKRVSLTEQWNLYLQKVQEDEGLERYLQNFLSSYMGKCSEKKMMEKVETAVKQQFKQFDLVCSINRKMMDALQSKQAEEIMDYWLEEAAANLKQEWIEDKLRILVDTFIEKRVRGFWGPVVSLLAQKTELINIEEISGLFFAKVQLLLLEMRENHLHPFRCSLRLKLRDGLHRIEENTVWEKMILELQEGIAEHVIAELRSANCHERFVLKLDAVLLCMEAVFKETWQAFLQHPENQKEFERICHEVMARLLFEVQDMLDGIVGAALAEMSDEKFNQLFYEKVSDDLIWIRMNGSIVGGVIGLLLFCAITWGSYLLKP